MALCVPPTLLHFSVNPILCCRRASHLEAQAETARRQFDCEPGMRQPAHSFQILKCSNLKSLPPFGVPPSSDPAAARPCPNRLKPELQTGATGHWRRAVATPGNKKGQPERAGLECKKKTIICGGGRRPDRSRPDRAWPAWRVRAPGSGHSD